MGGGETHELRIGDGRERVLRAAWAMFTARGFAEVSMQQIADAAGVTKATMYHHFQSKEELFGEVCRREMQQLSAGIDERVAAGGSLREQLERIARYFIETAVDEDVHRLMTDMHRHISPESAHALLRGCPTPLETVRPVFERAVAAGEMRPLDLDTVVAIFAGMVFGQVKLANHETGAEHLRKDLAPIIVDVLLSGIAAGDRGR